MKLLVTGATGFLGGAVVRAARERGHDVRALVRSAGRTIDVEEVVGDLRSRAGLVDALRGVDGVLHLAAQKSGGLYEQLAATVLGTENLLWAMAEAGVRDLVHVSTFSVYDYLELPQGSLLDESSPLEAHPERRDDYAITKLWQERIVREHESVRATILRPGVIWGPGEEWNARLGIRAGDRLWIRTGGRARLPLVHVDDCAQAIVLAAETEASRGEVINLVGRECPTQAEYVDALRRGLEPRPRVIPVPLWGMRFLAWTANLVSRLLFGGRAKIPGLLDSAKMEARLRPLEFSRAKAERLLGWTPEPRFPEALRS